MLKKCTPSWREANFEVKRYKAHRVQSSFGSWDAQKVHAVVARSTFRSQHVQSTSASEHFWKLRCRNSARCGAKHISKSTALKTDGLTVHFWTFRCGFAWQAQGILYLAESEYNVSFFVAFPKTMAGVGHLKRIWTDAFSLAGAVQETCSSEMLGGQGADFRRGVAFWSIRSAGLRRWFCVTGAALCMTWHQFFLAGAVLKTDEGSLAECFVFDAVNLKHWSLAVLCRFWPCQVQKLRKSHRIELADRQTDRQKDG